MDRKLVVHLIRNRLVECAQGKSRLWAVRCFEITAEAGLPVQVDEYEAFHEGAKPEDGTLAGMFHVGCSRIFADGRVVESPGTGRVDRNLKLTEPQTQGKV